MKFKFDIHSGGVSISFTEKPSEAVRGILKHNKFRSSPGRHVWFRRKVSSAADIMEVIQKQLEKEDGIRRPDAKCWTCGAEEGYFRNYGAAAAVYCDDCDRTNRAAESARQ